MSRVMEVTVYTFDELSEKAQDKAIEDFRTDVDYPWGGEDRDTLNAFEKVFPVKIKDWSYGGQGSYISFDFNQPWEDGFYHDGEYEEVELYRIRLRTYILNNYYETLFPPKYLGYVKGKSIYSKINREFTCSFTGFCRDMNILDPLINFIKKPVPGKTLEDLMRDCLDSWLDACDKDYEWQSSDECIRETIKANNYEFDEYGNMI